LSLLSVMLNQVNLQNNNNKFYVIQLIDLGGRYSVYTRWGRVGEIGQMKDFPSSSLAGALDTFGKKFKEKSANPWGPSVRDAFKPKAGKYTLLEMAYSDDEEEDDSPATKAVASSAGASRGAPKVAKGLQLKSPLLEFVKLIFDNDMFKEQLARANIDTDRMPLGKLSKTNIKKGLDVLAQIQSILKGEGGKKGDISVLTNQFYTLIPHASKRSEILPILSTEGQVEAKFELCNMLADVELAQGLIKAAGEEGEHPLDAQYHNLKCDMKPVDHNSETFKMIERYMTETGPEHKKLKLLDVFEVDRAGEGSRFAQHDDIKHRKLLWHGTNIAVVAAILASGLRIMPHSGGRVGKGLYFASENSKSAGYVRCSGEGIGCMFLTEVALGKEHEINADDSSLRQAPKGSDSIVARGWTEPDPSKDVVVKIEGHDVIVPQGKPIKTKWNTNSSFSQSEYLIYKESQARLRYVLKIQWPKGGMWW
jgi:poly [ADP-ribose] polymerase 2/3/4